MTDWTKAEYLTLTEVAEILRITYQSVWEWTTPGYCPASQPLIPTTKIGKFKRVKRSDLEEWIAKQQDTQEEKQVKYVIVNKSGQYWTMQGCWGVEQAAELYSSLNELPAKLDGLKREVHSTHERGGSLDIRYYRGKSQDSEARVVELGS